jgi:predicted dithiol-disulfide oxidoreductase (DUF899 family)
MEVFLTTEGAKRADELAVVETRRQAPAGVIVTTTYSFEGRVVKQDVQLRVGDRALRQEGG